jgi:1-acyl-sn-glycerol-3-phosphate acyltransferase
VVPVAIIGKRDILPKSGWRVRSGRIIVRFGAPLQSAQYNLNPRDQLMGRVRSEIEAALAAHAPQPGKANVRHQQHTRP